MSSNSDTASEADSCDYDASDSGSVHSAKFCKSTFDKFKDSSAIDNEKLLGVDGEKALEKSIGKKIYSLSKITRQFRGEEQGTWDALISWTDRIKQGSLRDSFKATSKTISMARAVEVAKELNKEQDLLKISKQYNNGKVLSE